MLITRAVSQSRETGNDTITLLHSPVVESKKTYPSAFVLQVQNIHLCVPQPRDGLGDTNIVCLERVEGKTQSDSSSAESPHGGCSSLGNTLGGEVVDDAGPVGR